MRRWRKWRNVTLILKYSMMLVTQLANNFNSQLKFRAGLRPISPIASNRAPNRFPGPRRFFFFFFFYVVVVVESENQPSDFFFPFLLLLFYFFLLFFFLTVKRHCVSLACIFVPSNIVASVPLICVVISQTLHLETLAVQGNEGLCMCKKNISVEIYQQCI